jgi:hypothetical protein
MSSQGYLQLRCSDIKEAFAGRSAASGAYRDRISQNGYCPSLRGGGTASQVGEGGKLCGIAHSAAKDLRKSSRKP